MAFVSDAQLFCNLGLCRLLHLQNILHEHIMGLISLLSTILSSREKISAEPGFEHQLLGEKQEYYLCVIRPPLCKT